MAKYFDAIVLFSFLTMLFLTLSMWVSYDKLQRRLNDQRVIITELVHANQDLTTIKEAFTNANGQLETELNRCKMLMRGTY